MRNLAENCRAEIQAAESGAVRAALQRYDRAGADQVRAEAQRQERRRQERLRDMSRTYVPIRGDRR